VEKFGKNNQKVGNTSRIISQTPTLGLEHDKVWAQWASDIISESMLERV
jgi:hypothetical protein